MNKKRFRRMKEQMVPSDAVRAELGEKMEAAQAAPKSNFLVKRVLPIAASLLLVIGGTAGVLVYRQLNRGAAPTAPQSGKIAGLPVKQALLSDMPGDASSMDMRIAIFGVRDFFEQELGGFVIARVTGTKAIAAAQDDFAGAGRQEATLEVIEWLYQTDAQAPAKITLTQNLLGGCTLEQQTNLLRKGGVYLLPLAQYEGQYSVMFDLEVLFEVDEQGKLFSHSSIEAFAAYDGKPYAALQEDVNQLLLNEPLLKSAPRFARVLKEGMPLAVVTVIGEAVEQPETMTYLQEVRVGKILEGELPGTCVLTVYSGEEKLLQTGAQYLMFVNEYEDEAQAVTRSLESNRAAKINADGTITPLTEDWNCFSTLAGKTVDEIAQLIK